MRVMESWTDYGRGYEDGEAKTIDCVLEIIDRLDAEAVEDFELDTDYGLAVVHDRFAKARKKIKALIAHREREKIDVAD